MDEEPLFGGVANAGGVVRSGSHVLRPTTPHSRSIHRFLAALHHAGFDGVPVPIGFEPDGRERLTFVEGVVAVPPYPEWAQSDSILVSIADLLRRFHRASREFDPSGFEWGTDLIDPRGGQIVCHNDVCLENVVLRDGSAIALIDFDFAAPGCPLVDVASFARMSVPIDDDVSAARLGWHDIDRGARLRLIADTYGLADGERAELIHLLGWAVDAHAEYVRRRVEAGDPGFVKMWTEMGGQRRLDRRRRWWADHRSELEIALLTG